ncbi:MAG TPA: Asp-tRNA(Asn)/Glu-tRNA(Gln) amidotransferase subunit GatC [Casimicrobiaceae bacterium]|nr:Asp-tRNA(Asn)/Glu-tRNA(Gln) amidotransferase subunit GatC [Casimicrobiaceae bacterium]
MAVSASDVERVAHLARIELTGDEMTDVQAKLDAIFGLVDELLAIDTAGIEPMSHAQDVMLPLREDAVTESDHHLLFQAQAPATEDGVYLVPRVIE